MADFARPPKYPSYREVLQAASDCQAKAAEEFADQQPDEVLWELAESYRHAEGWHDSAVQALNRELGF